MAQATTNIAVETPGILERVFLFLTRIAESNARIRKVEQLQALSDAELADMGLKRDRIVHFAFSDIMHI